MCVNVLLGSDLTGEGGYHIHRWYSCMEWLEIDVLVFVSSRGR